ncbi:hypothetical protein, partial [Shewanella sp. TC10]|uniref:hypothetical protein n=1 Tax=Shewanella sp. TC10 TaxID=1419739 RepID=UPI001E64A432
SFQLFIAPSLEPDGRAWLQGLINKLGVVIDSCGKGAKFARWAFGYLLINSSISPKSIALWVQPCTHRGGLP